MKELMMIQQELHAPKNQRNTFGNYNFRSCEDILLAVKPLLAKYECILLLSDEIKELSTSYTIHTVKNGKGGQDSYDYNGTRVYVEATAMLINKDGASISVKGLAREEPMKSGNDAAQTTGATSSYARKYALNGLFCIDDNKDYDTNEHHEEVKNKSSKNNKPISAPTPAPVPAPTPTPAPIAPKVIPAPEGWTREEVERRILQSTVILELQSIFATYGKDSEIKALLTKRKNEIENGTR